MTPEQKASQQIDALLGQCGWIIQDRSQTNLSAWPGVAIQEASLKTGEADYLLFAHGKVIATVEAKPEGYTLTDVEEQSGKCGKGLLYIFPTWGNPLPFHYESTGSEIRFTNRRDLNPASLGVFAFHRPEILIQWPGNAQLKQTLCDMPPLISLCS